LVSTRPSPTGPLLYSARNWPTHSLGNAPAAWRISGQSKEFCGRDRQNLFFLGARSSLKESSFLNKSKKPSNHHKIAAFIKTAKFINAIIRHRRVIRTATRVSKATQKAPLRQVQKVTVQPQLATAVHIGTSRQTHWITAKYRKRHASTQITMQQSASTISPMTTVTSMLLHRAPRLRLRSPRRRPARRNAVLRI